MAKKHMTISDPDNILAGAFAELDEGTLARDSRDKKSNTESNAEVRNDFSVRVASLDDSAMLESIELEAFPGVTPVTRLERDLARDNGLYLAVVRAWRKDERELGPRFAMATQSEKEDDSFTARVKRNVDRYVLDYVHRPKLPTDYIAGFIGLWFVLDEAHVAIIGIKEFERRKGLGELLLISGLEQAVVNDLRVVTLEVRESNKPAIELYRKHGFQQVGLRRRYYSDNGENAVIMTTPPIESDDYQNQFVSLVEQHAEKWGWVARPGFAGPKGYEEPETESELSEDRAVASVETDKDDQQVSPDGN